MLPDGRAKGYQSVSEKTSLIIENSAGWTRVLKQMRRNCSGWGLARLYRRPSPRVLASAAFVSSFFEITYYLPLSASSWAALCLLGDAGAAYGLFLLRLGSWGLGVCFGIVAASVWRVLVPVGILLARNTAHTPIHSILLFKQSGE